MTSTWRPGHDWWIALAIVGLVRPIAVLLTLANANISKLQQRLIAFFGIRGIGSIYYLTYAIEHGLDAGTAVSIGGIVLTTIAFSSLIHSNAASPILEYYLKTEH